MKPRSDSLRNLAKVAAVALNNPEAKQRDIAKQAWVSKGTARSKLGQLGQVKSDFVERVLTKDKEIIELGQRIIYDKLNDSNYVKKLKPTEISQVIKENTARYTLFQWDATDDKWGLKEIKGLSDEALEDLLFKKKTWQQA